mgnify:CR=1 FL=1|tara:strand:- start:682 stop:1137 length:456 start_codon:yes stop_codon:yes gene_type:complete
MIEEKYLMETHWNNYKEDYTTEAILLSTHLGVCVSEAESYIDSEDYLVLTDEQADEAVREYIEQTLWAFTPSFLSAHTNVSEEAIKKIQELYEGANDALAEMIKDFDEFVEDAIACDGRGHFLAFYDGNENEVTYKSIDNVETDYYIYRRD